MHDSALIQVTRDPYHGWAEFFYGGFLWPQWDASLGYLEVLEKMGVVKKVISACRGKVVYYVK